MNNMKTYRFFIVTIFLTLLLMTSLAFSSEDKLYLVFGFANDDKKSTIGYTKFEMKKSEWEVNGKEYLKGRIKEEFGTNQYTYKIIQPGWYYIYYTQINKKGIKKKYFPTIRDKSRFRKEQARIRELVTKYPKSQYVYVDDGFHNPSPTNKKPKSYDQFVSDLESMSINDGTYKCEKSEKMFKVRHVREGYFRFTDDEGRITKVNGRRLLQAEGDSKRLLKKFEEDFEKAIQFVCPSKVKDKKTRNSIVNLVRNILKSMAKKCEETGKHTFSDECKPDKKDRSGPNIGIQG